MRTGNYAGAMIDPLAWHLSLRGKLLRKGVPAAVVDQVLQCGHRERGEFARTLMNASPEEIEAIRRAATSIPSRELAEAFKAGLEATARDINERIAQVRDAIAAELSARQG